MTDEAGSRAMWDAVRADPRGDVLHARGPFGLREGGLARGSGAATFAGRAAPLGAAGPAVVAASFFNFRAPPSWPGPSLASGKLITPEEALRVRLAGVTSALGRLLDGREAEAGRGGRPALAGHRRASTSPAACSPRRTWRCRLPVTAWPGSGRRPRCCASTGATGTSPRWPRPTSTAARARGPAVRPGPAAGRHAAGAGLDRRGVGRRACPGWPRAAGSARTGALTSGGTRGTRGGGSTPPTGPRPGRGRGFGPEATAGDRGRPHPRSRRAVRGPCSPYPSPIGRAPRPADATGVSLRRTGRYGEHCGSPRQGM